MSTRRADDEGLAALEAFRAGDELALAGLYARWSPLVYSLALRTLGDVPGAEVVTQQVFTQAWALRQAFDPARTPFSAWLIDLCCDGLADRLQDRLATTGGGRSSAGVPTEGSRRAESKPGGLAERLVLADELSHLDAVVQRVLRMVLDDDLAPAEVAGRTGLSVEDVKTHIASGLMELRHRLEGEPDAH